MACGKCRSARGRFKKCAGGYAGLCGTKRRGHGKCKCWGRSHGRRVCRGYTASACRSR